MFLDFFFFFCFHLLCEINILRFRSKLYFTLFTSVMLFSLRISSFGSSDIDLLSKTLILRAATHHMLPFDSSSLECIVYKFIERNKYKSKKKYVLKHGDTLFKTAWQHKGTFSYASKSTPQPSTHSFIKAITRAPLQH